MAIGRPSDYTEDISIEICSRISDGESLRRICLDENMPNKATVFRWLHKNKAFSDQYARAKEEQADTLADDILDIADNNANDTYIDENGKVKIDSEVVARSRLKVDARKWIASKLKPKVYGDRIQQEISGSITIEQMSDEELDRKLAEKLTLAQKK